MSMLTPPGMGGKYRITGDKYPRMRRPSGRRRIVLAAVAALAAFGLIGWGTLQLVDVFTGGDEASAAAGGKDCARQPEHRSAAQKAAPLPEPRRITVNVFNATPREGLAKKTADDLKKRGFAVAKFDNATKTYDKKVKGPGIVLGPRSALDTALPVLATQLTGAEKRTDGRKGDTIDLILGAGFKGLTQEKDAAKALAALAKPSPAPSGPSSDDGRNC
ncbi:LytR C-terminal domain-containing protein [Streptomyces spectabilis]|uniref:LytR family transcriptional regulator n=1 Tax=Streptomyces spectabilis TaxID=68270 RepID=A0A516R9T4_STRST|nr:LytR C-terminal domain-containing protein [Streptomyces spectabilis]QDQ12411.1 LytR family transcriptional regulator [Streptomyces spectabilis]